MYQLVGPMKIAGAVAMLAALIALVQFFLWPLDEWTQLWRLASSSVSVSTAVILIVGQTAIFPWICRLWGFKSIFPPIDGEWRGIFRSNYPVIAQAFGLDAPAEGHEIVVKFVIRARLFKVRIHAVSLLPKPGYMRSDSTAFSIMRCAHTGRDIIHYVYDAYVGDPDSNDVDRFYGAARLTIIDEDDESSLEGTYWTDRNWTRGYNTAGSLVLRRC
jgi:uncharacterized membrane protein